MINIKEMALQYYSRLWNISRIKALYENGKLTDDEYIEIVGEPYNKQ